MFRIIPDAITEDFLEASLLREWGAKRVGSLLTDWLLCRRADWVWLSHLFIRVPGGLVEGSLCTHPVLQIPTGYTRKPS